MFSTVTREYWVTSKLPRLQRAKVYTRYIPWCSLNRFTPISLSTEIWGASEPSKCYWKAPTGRFFFLKKRVLTALRRYTKHGFNISCFKNVPSSDERSCESCLQMSKQHQNGYKNILLNASFSFAECVRVLFKISKNWKINLVLKKKNTDYQHTT